MSHIELSGLFRIPMRKLTWLYCCSVIDEYLIQAFRVDKLTFKGEWDNAPHNIGITMQELVGRGGMQDCYKVSISNFPPHFHVSAPDGWVAKVYQKDVSGNAYDLCRKVSVSFSLFKSSYSAIENI